jgi:hypothetical protein
MRKDATTSFLLMLIAIALIAIAIRPYLAPDPVHAQSGSPYPFYIEPGTQMLRAPDGSEQAHGRVVVDHEDLKGLGLPQLQLRHLPSKWNGQQVADFPPLRAGQVRLRRYRPIASFLAYW